MTTALALTALLPPAADAQSPYTEHTLQLDDPANRPPATIADVAWLAGDWEGEAFGGTFYETWGEPIDGTMLGMFRLVEGGATRLFEIEIIAEEAGSLVLKVKHLSPDFVAWEDKAEHVSFPLVRLTEDAAYFAGLTFRRIDADTIQGWVVASDQSGTREVSLTYRRVKRGS